MDSIRKARNYRRLNLLKRRRRVLLLRLSLLLLIVILILSTCVWIFNLIFGTKAAKSVASESVTSVVSSSVVDIYTHTSVVVNAENLKVIESSSAYTPALKELAKKNPDAVDYVYHYPEYKDKEFPIDLSKEATSEEVPLLMQWDKRWGYIPYGDGLVGYTGCGPTCLSMVALYFLDNPEFSPEYLTQFSTEQGYSVAGSGSSWELISVGSSMLGLSSKEVPLSETEMQKALDAGRLIIIVVGPGDFTSSGHYMVISGYDDTGFTILDPNSYEVSSQTWPYTTLESQMKNIWSIGL